MVSILISSGAQVTHLVIKWINRNKEVFVLMIQQAEKNKQTKRFISLLNYTKYCLAEVNMNKWSQVVLG